MRCRPPQARLARLLLAIGTGLAGAFTASAPGAADGPGAATFLDDRALNVTTEPGIALLIEDIVVLNSSADPVIFTIQLVGLLPKTATTATAVPSVVPTSQPIPGVDPTTLQSGVIAPGGTWAPVVTLEVPANAAGTYAGKVVVYGSDRSIARRDFSVTVQKAAAVSTANDTAREPLPETITLESIRQWPWDPVPTATLKLDPSLSAKVMPGPLLNDVGKLATVTLADDVVTVRASDQGAYKGVIARKPEGDEKVSAKLANLTLNARDGPWFPIGVLLVGVLLATFVEWLITDRLPRLSLDQRLAALEDRAKDYQNLHQQWMNSFSDWPGPVKTMPSIAGVESLMTKARSAALADFDGSPVDKRSDRWSAGGSEFLKVVAFVNVYDALLGQRKAVAVGWKSYFESTPDTDQLRRILQGSGFRTRVKDALDGAIIEDEPALTMLKTRLEKLPDKLGYATQLAKLLEAMAGLVADDSTKKYSEKVAILRKRLALLPGLVDDELQKVAQDADTLITSANPHKATLAADAFAGGGELSGVGVPVAGPFSRRIADVEPLLRSFARAGYRTWLWNAGYALLVAGIVVLLGLSTQYAGKAAFGSSADYLGLFAWAVVGTGAAQLVKTGAGALSAIIPKR